MRHTTRAAALALSALALSALALSALALAACGSSTHHPAAAASAAATSTAVHAAGQDVRQLTGKCLNPAHPATPPSLAQFSSLATSRVQQSALAQCLAIPQANRKPFTKAVLASILAWNQAHGFRTPAGRTAWTFGTTTLLTPSGTKVPSLAELIGEYQR